MHPSRRPADRRTPRADPGPARGLFRRLSRGLAVSLAAGLVVGLLGPTGPAHAGNRVTPGDLTGYGFDQCLAPSQSAMDTWMNTSPFLAVGIYISGDSRGCRSQPNLTPAWISHQLRRGWRLLPITLGPQASCSPHFPRYGHDETINPRPGAEGNYWRARRQGRREAVKTVDAATALGIAARSTLWYDLEAFDISKTRCRESALLFLSAWVSKVDSLGFRTGVYSSAASGIKMLDNARVAGRDVSLPDHVWIARWDGKANTSTTYISDEGWNPHRRVKQYQGGHNETWGGVTINIDRNWLDVGRGSVAPPREVFCGGVRVSWADYGRIAPGDDKPGRTRTLQCLLQRKGFYDGAIDGVYDEATIAAAAAWKRSVGSRATSTFTNRQWVRLLAEGSRPVIKVGSAALAVRRLQRAMNAALASPVLQVSGVFDRATDGALRKWQQRVGLPVTGVAARNTWERLSG